MDPFAVPKPKRPLDQPECVSGSNSLPQPSAASNTPHAGSLYVILLRSRYSHSNDSKVFTMPESDPQTLHKVLRQLAGWAVWSFFTEVRVVGAENVPVEGPIIV